MINFLDTWNIDLLHTASLNPSRLLRTADRIVQLEQLIWLVLA